MKALRLWPEFKHRHGSENNPRRLGVLLATEECAREDFDYTAYNADHIKDEYSAYLTNGEIAELSPREWNEFVDGFHAGIRARKKPAYSILPESEVIRERCWDDESLRHLFKDFITEHGLETQLGDYLRKRAEQEWEDSFPD